MKKRKSSDVRYMDNKPDHFVTNVANPYTRYGDDPYKKCPKCHRLCTALGLRRHVDTCKEKTK